MDLITAIHPAKHASKSMNTMMEKIETEIKEAEAKGQSPEEIKAIWRTHVNAFHHKYAPGTVSAKFDSWLAQNIAITQSFGYPDEAKRIKEIKKAGERLRAELKVACGMMQLAGDRIMTHVDSMGESMRKLKGEARKNKKRKPSEKATLQTKKKHKVA